MQLELRKHVNILIFTTIIFSLWSLALYFIPEKETFWNNLYPIYAMIYLYPAIVGFNFLRKSGTDGVVKKALTWLSISFFFYSAALFMQAYLVLFVTQEFYPSFADWFFIIHFIFLTGGSIYLLRMYSSQLRLRHLISFMLSLVATVYIVLKFYGLPELGLEDSTLIITFFDISYFVFGVLNIFLSILILLFAGGKIFKGVTFFVVGSVLQTIADFFFSARIEEGIFYGGDYTDFLYLISGLFWALAIVYTIYSLKERKIQIN